MISVVLTARPPEEMASKPPPLRIVELAVPPADTFRTPPLPMVVALATPADVLLRATLTKPPSTTGGARAMAA